MQLRDTTENFPDDDEIFGCWIHTIDFALDFHWKSTFSEKKSESEIFENSIFQNRYRSSPRRSYDPGVLRNVSPALPALILSAQGG